MAIVGSAAFATTSQAQGLLGIGAVDEDFESGLPFTTTLSLDFGWDSNANTSSVAEESSAYTRAGIGVRWVNGTRRTNFTLGGSFSTLYYFDGLESADDNPLYNGRVSLDVRHTVNRRMTLGNNFYLSYETDPDFAIGASTSRRTDNYLYGYNSTWMSYAWSRRFSTVTRFTITGIQYDEDIVGRSEDRLTMTFSQEARYLLNRLTTLVGEYRLSHSDYDDINRGYLAHYILGGFDHTFSRNTTATLRLGAEIRDSDVYGSDTKPYGEFAIRYRHTEHSSFHWITRIGNEDSELTNYQRRFSYRSSLSYNQQFTDRLVGRAGVTYLHNDFDTPTIAESPDNDEDLISLNVGLSYRIMSNIDLNAGYYFTTISSDNRFREYDRHRVSLGVSTTF